MVADPAGPRAGILNPAPFNLGFVFPRQVLTWFRHCATIPADPRSGTESGQRIWFRSVISGRRRYSESNSSRVEEPRLPGNRMGG
jgi:hypothetical protein